ncbi:hypothetical protein PPYR_15329 [Photinus pyralis]|nr:hypothetical protein PPYR_15329 [Photinus pyralis]
MASQIDLQYSYSDDSHLESVTSETDSVTVDLDRAGADVDTSTIAKRFNLKLLTENLSEWIVTENITHTSASKLLKMLKHCGCEHLQTLPSDARTLLKTPRVTRVDVIQPGTFFYFGIKDTINEFFSKNNCFGLLSDTSVIELAVNVDGLPLSKSSNSSFWPILGVVKSLSTVKDKVLLFGLYHGYQKPENSNEFLKQFVEEASALIDNGIEINGHHLDFKVKMLICDLPARSYVLRVKGHSGHFSCNRCTQEGDMINNRMCFPELHFTKRTDNSFRNRAQPQHHHNEPTILLNLPSFDIIQDVPLDYMHLLCLGVMKRVLADTKFGLVLGKPGYKLPARDVLAISNLVLKLKKYVPCEFSRKTRPLLEVKRYKATEFRFFLLYALPVVLRNVMKKNKFYKNILKLHVASSILVSPNLCSDQNYQETAKELLYSFVKQSKKLYGADFISHNVHCLLHLVDDTNRFGPLDNFSAFPFENYMKTLKRMVRKTHQPLQQVVRRSQESWHSRNTAPDTGEEQNSRNEECSVRTLEWIIKTNNADCYFELESGEIGKAKCIFFQQNKKIVTANFFKTKQSFYTVPLDSSALGIFLCSDLSIEDQLIDSQYIKCKVMLLPFDQKFVSFRMLHTI